MEIDPTFYLPHFYLGEALQDKGDLSGAIPEYTRALQLNDTLIGRVYLAAAKTQSGNKGAAQQMLTELEELSQRSYVPAYLRALLYLSLGNRDEAIRWLEQSFADYERGYSIWITVDPLRGDPRFKALVQKVVGAKHQ